MICLSIFVRATGSRTRQGLSPRGMDVTHSFTEAWREKQTKTTATT